MYVGRELSELTQIPVDQWELTELLYFQNTMSELATFLTNEGVSLHMKIIHELEARGPIGDSGGWDRPSIPVYE